MKHSTIFILFYLTLIVNISFVHAGYSVEPHAERPGPSDSLGADRNISFFDLPLWIQVAEVTGFLLAVLGVIKFGPLLLGKVKTILENKNRTAILAYIGANPGCTIAEVSKNTDINRGTTKYHLYLLMIERKNIRMKDGKLSYLFTNSGAPLERKRVYGYIMNPTKREILTIILNQPGISNKEIADSLQLSRSTVHWHLQQFLEEEMIVSRWDGRNMNYTLFPDVEDILGNVQGKFSEPQDQIHWPSESDPSFRKN